MKAPGRGEHNERRRHNAACSSYISRGHEIIHVARVELERAFKIPQGLGPAALAPVHQAEFEVDCGVVRQGAPGQLELAPGLVVVAQPAGEVPSPDEIDFTGIGLEAGGLLDRFLRSPQSGGSVIVTFIKKKMYSGERAISAQEMGIARHRLLQQFDRLELALGIRSHAHDAGLLKKIARDQVARGRARQGGFFGGGDFRRAAPAIVRAISL